MNVHPEFRDVLARQRQRDRFAAAERERLLALARRRDPAPVRDAGLAIAIRPATPADARALADLAILDGAGPIDGEVLVATVGGRLTAACSLADGRTIADPFRPTRHARALLERRREQIVAAERRDARGARRRWLQFRLGS